MTPDRHESIGHEWVSIHRVSTEHRQPFIIFRDSFFLSLSFWRRLKKINMVVSNVAVMAFCLYSDGRASQCALSWIGATGAAASRCPSAVWNGSTFSAPADRSVGPTQVHALRPAFLPARSLSVNCWERERKSLLLLFLQSFSFYFAPRRVALFSSTPSQTASSTSPNDKTKKQKNEKWK